jgi:hypothetical protein
MWLDMTEEQMSVLVELVYLGAWLANSARDDEIEPLVDMEYTIYGMAAEAGVPYLVESSRRPGMQVPDVTFEERMDVYIAAYDEAVFWDELAVRLSHEMLRREHGALLDGMGAVERRALEERMLERCEAELKTHGLARVRLDLSV